MVIDMSTAHTEEVRSSGPQAEIVYDLFRLVAKYRREVIDRVRVDETNRVARANGSNDMPSRDRRRVVKGTHWLLLKNRENTTKKSDRVRLRDLLKANRALFVGYVLKDDLKQPWQYSYPGAARRFWRAWHRHEGHSHSGSGRFRREPFDSHRRSDQPLPLSAPHRDRLADQQQDQRPEELHILLAITAVSHFPHRTAPMPSRRS